MTKSKVAIVQCDSYDEEKVYHAVKDAITYMGGLENHVQKNEKILVKPNFLYAAEAEKCVTTHDSVIKAMIRILEEEGYSDFSCGDSPGMGSCRGAYEKLGLDPKYIANMDKEVFHEGLYYTEEALAADAIIGLCKMKTHMLERITGAVKNMYGLICGYRKAVGHTKYPTAASFAKMMTKIHKATNQRFHIMDAIYAMEGNGPSGGTPIFMGMIIASPDPVALDAVFCHLVHLNPAYVPTESYGYKEGLGTYKTDEIELTLDGQPISMDELVAKLGKPNFDVQRDRDRINILSVLSHVTGAFSAKPVIDADKCIKCGICVNHCPVDGKAVNFTNGKDKVPVYDYRKCIRCYCCQELCPQHAIRKK